jgi:hypothetical protein
MTGKDPIRYRCPKCEKAFGSEAELQEHEKHHTSDSERQRSPQAADRPSAPGQTGGSGPAFCQRPFARDLFAAFREA